MKYYFAYGQNTDYDVMRFRAPQSRLCGLSYIEGYELKFNGHATIHKHQDPSKRCYGVLWLISKSDEVKLDIAEGFPTIYRKLILPSCMPIYSNNLIQDTLVYQMVSDKISDPYLYDFQIIRNFRTKYNLDCV